jgi:SPP1 gp7 family putative phage head morphogenesis protein
MQDTVNSTLAARFNLHQEGMIADSEKIADKADKDLQAMWRDMDKVIFKSKASLMEKSSQIHLLLTKTIHGLFSTLYHGFVETTKVSYSEAGLVVVQTLPQAYLHLLSYPMQEERKSKEEREAEAVQAAIFPPMHEEKVHDIVYGTTLGTTWNARLAQQTNLGNLQHIARKIAQDFAAGKSPQGISESIRPLVQGNAAAARRIARTECQRIAHESRMETYEKLGDLVIGYQIHATMDSRVRPHHAARSGTVYYKNPQPHQLGIQHMPRPPIDEDGTVAHNCRCWITPVLKLQKQVENNPAAKKVFRDNKGKLIPNPAVYSQWFQKAPERARMRVVGADRYRIMQDKFPAGHQIKWGYFIDPRSGQLMDEDVLQREDLNKFDKRMRIFDELLRIRKSLTRSVSNYGYINPYTAKSILPKK